MPKLSVNDYDTLASTLRRQIIDTAYKAGTHLGSPLGAVELTIALHAVFDSSTDRLVFDTGHQAYAHKLLTDRSDNFQYLRTRQGPSGFPSTRESLHDAFGVGHASTSIAAAYGYTYSTTRLHRDDWTVAVIGDAALAGGEALEALNLLRGAGRHVGVVLNDNRHSISAAVGALASSDETYEHLAAAFGLTYLGPLDGHDTAALVDNLRAARALGEPFLLHARTIKGRGDPEAERSPVSGHAVSLGGGKGRQANKEVMRFLEERHRSGTPLALLTPGMAHASGLLSGTAPSQIPMIDFGIAEPTVVTAGAAMQLGGVEAWVHLYSTFMMRATDQLIHDVGLQHVNMHLLVDRVGFCGADGPTHHGLSDLAVLGSMPHSKVFSIFTTGSLAQALSESVERAEGVTCVRYSKGDLLPLEADYAEGFAVVRRGTDLTLVSHGRQLGVCLEVANALNDLGLSTTVIDAYRVHPIPERLTAFLADQATPTAVVEEAVHQGSLGSRLGVALLSTTQRSPFKHIYVDDIDVAHGTVTEQLNDAGLSKESILGQILSWIKSGDVVGDDFPLRTRARQ